MLELQVNWYWPVVSFVRVQHIYHMTLLQLKRMEKRFWCPQERRNTQKLHVQDVQNCLLLAVTLSPVICYKIFDVVTKLWLAMQRERFVSEKGLFFETQLEWLNLHVPEACLQACVYFVSSLHNYAHPWNFIYMYKYLVTQLWHVIVQTYQHPWAWLYALSTTEVELTLTRQK